MSYENLFQPLAIGRKKAKNRISIAPSAPFLVNHDGTMSPAYYEFTRSMARTGAAVVTTGVTTVDPGASLRSRTLSAGSDLYLPDLEEYSELVHSYDALASCELVSSRYMLTPAPKTVNETSTSDVEAIIASFAAAAERLVKTGFDLALIHGGHGNVPAMFFNASINKRTDRFGGSFEGRCQFAIELLQAVREAVGDKLAIEWRISAEEMLPGMTTFEETLTFAKVIEPYIDLLHVSRGLLSEDSLLHYINAPLYLPKALNLPFAERFKQELAIPVTCVGSFDLDIANEAVAAGKVDMVSMVRAAYADNELVEKARLGNEEDIRPCVRCNTCIDRTHTRRLTVRCAVNPRLGRESYFPPENAQAPVSKRVAVIGGGPAGMQAALTLAQRGHAPVLFEKDAELGGLLRLAGADAMKAEIKSYVEWMIRKVQSDGRIDVRMGTSVDPHALATGDYGEFDEVVLACGMDPVVPAWASSDELHVRWFGDIEKGEPLPEGRVLVGGTGMTGLECALSLSRQGRDVALVGALGPEADGLGGTTISLRCLLEELQKAGVSIIHNSMVTGVCKDGVVVQHPDESTETIACASFVLAFGFRMKRDEVAAFEAEFPRLYRIGDCRGKVCTIFNATQSAYDVAMRI